MGVQVFIFCSATVYQPLFPIPPLPSPAPHPPPHQYQHQYNPRQPDPVELGEDHRLTSGGEIGLQLEGGDPDHLPGGEETLVTPPLILDTHLSEPGVAYANIKRMGVPALMEKRMSWCK